MNITHYTMMIAENLASDHVRISLWSFIGAECLSLLYNF